MPVPMPPKNKKEFSWGRFSKTLSFWILILLIPVVLIKLTGAKSDAAQNVSYTQLTAFLHQHCAALLNPTPVPAGTSRVPAGDPGALCLDEVSKTFRLAITYHPRSQYWAFQWLEAGIFVDLAVVAVATTFWWVTHRSR